MKCSLCEKGELKKTKIAEVMFGVILGNFPAERCSFCGETFTDEITTKRIEEAAKKKGIWGIGMKTKIAKTGNSLAVRIPQRIAKFLDLKEGEETYIYPEKNKLIVEPRP